jgi:hypothetical protein
MYACCASSDASVKIASCKKPPGLLSTACTLSGTKVHVIAKLLSRSFDSKLLGFKRRYTHSSDFLLRFGVAVD